MLISGVCLAVSLLKDVLVREHEQDNTKKHELKDLLSYLSCWHCANISVS